MKNRRDFVRSMVLANAAFAVGGATKDLLAADKETITRGRRFVAACPNANKTIGRKPGPIRVMVIGAHPDDADITCGCFELKLIAQGCKVKFVSVTDGRMGYWAAKKQFDATRFADAWQARYPGKATPRYMEAYEVSEYGRAPTEEDFRVLLGE